VYVSCGVRVGSACIVLRSFGSCRRITGEEEVQVEVAAFRGLNDAQEALAPRVCGKYAIISLLNRFNVKVRWCSWLSRSSHRCDHERSPVRARVEPFFSLIFFLALSTG
jgi:hypothetical protein